jgi:hypothetical protein
MNEKYNAQGKSPLVDHSPKPRKPPHESTRGTLGYVHREKKKRVMSAMAKMSSSGFDPLTKLMNLYASLEAEDAYWCDVRDGAVVVYDGETKKQLKYSSMAHQAVLAQMATIGIQLMRFKYARVSEAQTAVGTKKSSPLKISLTGGKTFVLNPDDERQAMPGEDVEDDWE